MGGNGGWKEPGRSRKTKKNIIKDKITVEIFEKIGKVTIEKKEDGRWEFTKDNSVVWRVWESSGKYNEIKTWVQTIKDVNRKNKIAKILILKYLNNKGKKINKVIVQFKKTDRSKQFYEIEEGVVRLIINTGLAWT